MTERSERFRSRRARLHGRPEDNQPPMTDAKLVRNALSYEVDWTLVGSVALEVPVFNHEVAEEEVTRYLSDLDEHFTQRKYDALFDSIKDTLIDQLLRPVGLSRSDLMDTDRKFMYKDVEKDYERGWNAARKEKRSDKIGPDGTMTDEYTGRSHPAEEMDTDHIISKKEVHERGGFMLDADEKAETVNNQDNLANTQRSVNRSKGARKLTDQPNTDMRRTKPAQSRAEKAIGDRIPKGSDFARRAARDGVQVGTRQGLQQAFSLLMSELISAVFSEVKDVMERGWKAGDYSLSWLEPLGERLERIRRRLLARWRGVVAVSVKGGLSGFLSTIMTALFNALWRTGKHIVRIMREGFLSIVGALNVLLHPPEGMSLREAAHEASKIFITGLVVTGGMLAGESIAESFGVMPNVLAPVLGGLISGAGSLLVVFLLDKLDLFGVAFDERHAFIMGTLGDRISNVTRKIEDIVAESGPAVRMHSQEAP